MPLSDAALSIPPGYCVARCYRATTGAPAVTSLIIRQKSRVKRRTAIASAVATAALLILLCSAVVSQADNVDGRSLSHSDAAADETMSLRSSEDGWLDASDFLDKTYGFLPVIIPITEPAVGYGAFGALAFIDRPSVKADDGFGRPNITLVGGLLTQNDTRGGMAGDLRHWMDGRLQTLVAGFRASVNLDFYGIGESAPLKSDPLAYNLDTSAVAVRAKYRLGDSRFWAGLGYAFANTDVKFDAPASSIGIPEYRQQSRVGGVTPTFSYDSRDNIFTPVRGSYIDASVGLFSHALGGDDEFQRASVTAIHYLTLGADLYLGVCGGAVLSFGEVPFYLRPFVQLRGAPLMRYQGDEAAQIEAEMRW